MTLFLNDINFPISFINKYKDIFEKEKEDDLFKHQKLVYEFIQNPDTRGILVYHQLGTGKTITAIASADILKRPTIIMCAASIKFNFIQQYGIYHGLIERDTILNEETTKTIKNHMKNKYQFSSINASNKYDQIIRASYNLDKSYTGKDILEGKTIIVDEAHKFMSFVISPESEQGKQLYDLIRETKDLKIIFLTGTPIVNTPFEMVPMFNMLSNLEECLPESVVRFNDYFIGYDEEKDVPIITNGDVLKQRIMGMISYFSGKKEEDDSKYYPKFDGIKNVIVNMSEYQWSIYVKYRLDEIAKEQKRIGQVKEQGESIKLAKKNEDTFMMNTRQVSNFALPEDIEKILAKRPMEFEEIDGMINDEDIRENIDEYSPKLAKMYLNIEENEGKKQLVYSNFLHKGGLLILRRLLISMGWSEYEEGKKTGAKTFYIWSGETTDTSKNAIISIFNSSDNNHGEKISLLMITSAGSEGINLLGVRVVHIMEPYWHQTRINQVIGRAIRYKSHVELPKNEQNVEAYLYMSDVEKKWKAKKSNFEKEPTDLRIYNMAIKKQELVDKFLDLIKEASFDCSFNREKKSKYSCFVCSPARESIKINFETVEEQLLPEYNKCVLPYILPIDKLEKTKDGFVKYKGELYKQLPYIEPPRFIKIKKT